MQAAYGKCSSGWMVSNAQSQYGYCAATCNRCSCQQSVFPSPSATPSSPPSPPQGPVTASSTCDSCTDIPPDNQTTCQQQVSNLMLTATQVLVLSHPWYLWGSSNGITTTQLWSCPFESAVWCFYRRTGESATAAGCFPQPSHPTATVLSHAADAAVSNLRNPAPVQVRLQVPSQAQPHVAAAQISLRITNTPASNRLSLYTLPWI